MSWQTINKILGLAITDPKFAHRLLTNPLSATQELGFDLTEEEQEALGQVKASDMSELSQILVERFSPEK